MSGFFSNVLRSFTGGGQDGGDQPQGVMGLVQKVVAENGGVGGIIEKLQQSGFADKAASWVGNGENEPISADHVGQVFSPDQIGEWAGKFGISPDTVKDVLAQALPHAVDHATPDGEVQQNGGSIDWMGLANRFLNGGKQSE